MPSKLEKNKPPQLPKKKMPLMRASLMIGAAIFISMLIFIFAIFPITAPMMIGVGTGTVAEHYTHSTFVGVVVGGFTVAASGFVEAISGIGVPVLGAIGNLLADAFTFLGWVMFYLWLTVIGVPLIGRGAAARKRLITALMSTVIGFVPLLNILPAFLIGVTLIVISVRMEDAEKLIQYKEQLKKYNMSRKTLSSNTKPQMRRV